MEAGTAAVSLPFSREDSACRVRRAPSRLAEDMASELHPLWKIPSRERLSCDGLDTVGTSVSSITHKSHDSIYLFFHWRNRAVPSAGQSPDRRGSGRAWLFFHCGYRAVPPTTRV
ncbi:unnamed protein product [Lampetra fluviatilis]